MVFIRKNISKNFFEGSETTNQKMDLSSVSSLPIDPSAAYNYDMGNFFTGKSTKLIKPCEEVQPQFNLNNEIITGGKGELYKQDCC